MSWRVDLCTILVVEGKSFNTRERSLDRDKYTAKSSVRARRWFPNKSRDRIEKDTSTPLVHTPQIPLPKATQRSAVISLGTKWRSMGLDKGINSPVEESFRER